jgi:hypothetical protein
MVGTLSKNLNLFLAWSHMDFWKQTKINWHYILTIILHLISLSQNIATFLLKNEYYLDVVNRYTTVDTSWVRITSPSGMHEFISCFLFSFGVDPFQFSILSIGKLCLPMSLSIIVFIMVSWFLAFDHLFVPSDDMQFHCRFRSDCYIIVRQ